MRLAALLLLLASTASAVQLDSPAQERALASATAPREGDIPAFAALERHLEPPLDAAGRAWLVEVVAEVPEVSREPVAPAAANPDGTWRHAKVPAGNPVRLRVRTETGDVWWTSPEAFDPAEAPPEGAIDLGFVPVRGVARVGKQPLEGLATFTDRSGVNVSLVVDTDGRFEGALPRDGKWTVRTKSVRVAFGKEMEVEVPRPESTREGKALSSFVDVHFPDLALRGEVVDEEGKPVEGFTLWIGLGRGTSSVPWTYEGSTFRYDRIAMGTTYELYVTVPWRSSPVYRVEVPPDDDPEFVRAVVGTSKLFQGHVVSSTGRPLQRASGFLAAAPGNGLDRSWLYSWGPRALFVGRVPERSRFVCVVLSSPGQAMHLAAREANGDDHEIVLSPDGGRLDLEAPVDPLRVGALFHDGCALRLDVIEKASGASTVRRGRTLAVLSGLVEPGPWSFCLVTRGALETYVGEAPSFPLCAHGDLEAGGRLELKIPDAAAAPSP